MKLNDANYKIFWNVLAFCDPFLSHPKMSDYVLFPLFGFTLTIKLQNFDFESHSNTLIFFYKKKKEKMMSDLNMSCEAVSDLV